MSVPFAHVIGDPISQSKSPLIHSFWLEKLGIGGRYKARHVLPGGLKDYLDKYRTDGAWSGCNVTMPHKQMIMPYLDVIDPIAAKLGAVNTVVRQENGGLIGYNTDLGGFMEPITPLLKSPHLFRMARVLGTGGAARAIIAALADQGFTLVVAGRDPEKARAIIREVAPKGEHHTVALDHFNSPTDFDFDDREGCLDLVQALLRILIPIPTEKPLRHRESPAKTSE